MVGANVKLERVAFEHLEPAGVTFGDLTKHCDRTSVPFDGNHAARTCGKQSAGQSAGPGTNLNDRYVIEWSGCPRDARRQIEIQQKILAKGLFGGKVMASD